MCGSVVVIRKNLYVDSRVVLGQIATSIQSSRHINIHVASAISVCIPQKQFSMKQTILTVMLAALASFLLFILD